MISNKTHELVKKTKKELAAYRKQFEDDWNKFDDAYYGKQHITGEHHKVVKNHVFKIIESQVPILTDSMSGTRAIAESGERQDDAALLEKSIAYVYKRQNLPMKLPTLVRSSLISGPGYLYVYHDSDADNGNGAIRFKQLMWKSVFLDGDVDDIQDSSKTVIEHTVRRDALKSIYPEMAEEIDKVKSDGTMDAVDDNNYETRDLSGSEKYPSGKPKEYKADDILCVKETYLKDYQLVEIEEGETLEETEAENADLIQGVAVNIKKFEDHEAHQQKHLEARGQLLAQFGLEPETPFEEVAEFLQALGQQNPEIGEGFNEILLAVKVIDNHIEEHEIMKEQNPEGGKPKFNDGLRVIKSVGKVILYDGPNVPENGMVPLVPFYAYKDHTVYGFSEVKNILSGQRTLNTVDDYEYRNLKLNANTGWIGDKDSEVDETTLTNEPGLVVLKKRGTDIRRMEPGTVSPQLERRKVNDAREMEDISGINEATQGKTPSANASGYSIERLQNQAIGRIRLKQRVNDYYSIKRLGELTASFIIHFWSDEKILRLTDDTGQIEEHIFDPIRMQELNYSIEIEPGSMAGIDRDALNAYYINLFQLGLTDKITTLKMLDFPKKQMAITAAEENDEVAAQLEQMQMQMERLQIQNAQLRQLINPELVSNEEARAVEEFNRQEAINSLTNAGANEGQPVT